MSCFFKDIYKNNMATFLREGQDCHAPINGNQDRIFRIIRIQACTLKRNIVFETIFPFTD